MINLDFLGFVVVFFFYYFKVLVGLFFSLSLLVQEVFIFCFI